MTRRTENESPFPPVASRRSAAAAAPTTTQNNPYPGLRAVKGAGGYSKTVPPMRHIAQEEEEEEELDSPDDPPRRRTTVVVRPPVQATRRLKRTRFHWLVLVGLAMVVMIIGWLTFSAFSSWWSTTQDDWHYGRPRTYQTDAVVGHGDSASNPSHFIALNLNGQMLVIEIPGGNASKAQVYIGPRLFGAGQDLAPVTLSFDDCNGDGKPDLNIHIAGSDKIICFPNNGKTFTTTQQQP